jgi:hypothetical protein
MHLGHGAIAVAATGECCGALWQQLHVEGWDVAPELFVDQSTTQSWTFGVLSGAAVARVGSSVAVLHLQRVW